MSQTTLEHPSHAETPPIGVTLRRDHHLGHEAESVGLLRRVVTFGRGVLLVAAEQWSRRRSDNRPAEPRHRAATGLEAFRDRRAARAMEREIAADSSESRVAPLALGAMSLAAFMGTGALLDGGQQMMREAFFNRPVSAVGSEVDPGSVGGLFERVDDKALYGGGAVIADRSVDAAGHPVIISSFVIPGATMEVSHTTGLPGPNNIQATSIDILGLEHLRFTRQPGHDDVAVYRVAGDGTAQAVVDAEAGRVVLQQAAAALES